jgi:hypothetical protein
VAGSSGPDSGGDGVTEEIRIILADDRADPFFGYYTLHKPPNGEIGGMLGVHGLFVQMVDEQDHHQHAPSRILLYFLRCVYSSPSFLRKDGPGNGRPNRGAKMQKSKTPAARGASPMMARIQPPVPCTNNRPIRIKANPARARTIRPVVPPRKANSAFILTSSVVSVLVT